MSEFDLYIECRDVNWQTHKDLVCLKSTELAYACQETADKRWRYDPPVLRYIPSTNPGAPSTLILDEDDVAVVDCMLHFMYYENYEVPDEETGDMLLFHAKVFDMADRYGIPGLRTAAVAKFEAEFKDLLQNRREDTYPLFSLRTIKYAYTVPFDTSQELRQSIIRIASPHAKWFFANRWDFKDFKEQCPQFTFEMVQQM